MIDDRAGRQAADNLNISKIGLVGILLLAKKRGLVDNVGSLLEELRAAGYWLSDQVIAVARKLRGQLLIDLQKPSSLSSDD